MPDVAMEKHQQSPVLTSSYFTHLAFSTKHELIKGDMEGTYEGGPIVNYDLPPVWDDFEEEEIEEVMEAAQHINEPSLAKLYLEQQKKVDMEQEDDTSFQQS